MIFLPFLGEIKVEEDNSNFVDLIVELVVVEAKTDDVVCMIVDSIMLLALDSVTTVEVDSCCCFCSWADVVSAFSVVVVDEIDSKVVVVVVVGGAVFCSSELCSIENEEVGVENNGSIFISESDLSEGDDDDESVCCC
jgi:hypothetical protein